MHHANNDDTTGLFWLGVSALIVLAGYFLPTFIAFARGHTQRGSIFFLNLILGWTGFIWIYLILRALEFI